MNILTVQAAAGLRLPQEGTARTFITDAAPVQVVDSHYYRKAIADGDLVEVPPKADTAAAKTAAKDVA